MINSLLQKRIEKSRKKKQEELHYIDVDYRGFRDDNIELTICQNGQAILNAYKVWLQSRKGDYIRNWGFGGFFQNCCNEWPYEPESADKIKEALIEETAEKWPTIQLVECEVKMTHQLSYPGWEVRVVPMDKITGYVGIEMYMNNRDNITIHKTK